MWGAQGCGAGSRSPEGRVVAGCWEVSKKAGTPPAAAGSCCSTSSLRPDGMMEAPEYDKWDAQTWALGPVLLLLVAAPSFCCFWVHSPEGGSFLFTSSCFGGPPGLFPHPFIAYDPELTNELEVGVSVRVFQEQNRPKTKQNGSGWRRIWPSLFTPPVDPNGRQEQQQPPCDHEEQAKGHMLGTAWQGKGRHSSGWENSTKHLDQRPP